MSASGLIVNIRPTAGLVSGPLLWIVSTQLGSVWPWIECGAAHRAAALTSFAFAAIAGVASFGSWSSRDLGRSNLMSYPRSTAFVAGLGSLTGVIFAFVLVLQGAADLVLDACQR